MTESTELSPVNIADISPSYWAQIRQVRLQAGIFSLEDRHYQQEPMDSQAKRKCYMKGTQLGFTEIEVLSSLHAMIHKRCKLGVLYLFPTADDVGDFSKSRFNPLIKANPMYIGRFVKDTDTAGLKKVRSAFLYLRGARLTQGIGLVGEEREASKLRSIPVDKCVFDELDLMDELVIAKAEGRMGASPLQQSVYISNPTIPDLGIDKIFQLSDQRYLHRRCEACNEWTSAEESFPDCVKTREDGTGYIACKKCGREVGIGRAYKTEWVPKKPENRQCRNPIEGWQLGQLSSLHNDPADILDAYNDPPQGNLGDVMRLRLGLPYVAAEDKLSEGVVLECCGTEPMRGIHPGQCAMGVDVGKINRVLIGTRTGADRYELVKIICLSKWSDIHDLARKFNVKSAVLDILPESNTVRDFQKAEPYRVFLCQYSESRAQGVAYNDQTGIVIVDRTELCDRSHKVIADKRIVLPRKCPMVDQFAAECCHTAKVLETNKRSGTAIYRYRKVGGEDHFRHTLNYFLLAASGGKIARVGGTGNQATTVISEYDVI